MQVRGVCWSLANVRNLGNFGTFIGHSTSRNPTEDFCRAFRILLLTPELAMPILWRTPETEGARGADEDKTLGGHAVSRTRSDREAVFFCASDNAMSGAVLLRGGRVVDPATGLDGRADVRVREGMVAAVGALTPEPAERVIEFDGCVVAPGLIDVHVHLREPGQEWKETIATGTAAAAAGGFTRIFCMPNTEPALDSVVALEELKRRVDRDAVVAVHPIAAISEGRRGQRAVDYDALAAAGAIGFSDDGDTTRDAGIMRAALEASRRTSLPVMVHCEEPSLTGGAMHEGDISRQLGIEAIPAAAEELIIERDLGLAALTGGWLHVCHVTTARGAESIGAAKAEGVRVTAEVMPHHLMMTDAWVAGWRALELVDAESRPEAQVADPDTKVNPPLRTADDALHLLHALRRGTIEVVATDHAPHARSEKQGRSFAAAAFGLNGSELALPLMLALVRSGTLSMSEVIASLSTTPARLWGLDAGSLRTGAVADIVVFDPEESWVPSADCLATRSANSPLLGMELRGRVKLTLVGGDERYRDW
jgi:dihydroorotase